MQWNDEIGDNLIRFDKFSFSIRICTEAEEKIYFTDNKS